MNEPLLLAVEIEISVLLKSFFATLPTKKAKRAFLKELRRNTRKHAKDRRKVGGDAAAAVEIALPRLKSHISELKSLLP